MKDAAKARRWLAVGIGIVLPLSLWPISKPFLGPMSPLRLVVQFKTPLEAARIRYTTHGLPGFSEEPMPLGWFAHDRRRVIIELLPLPSPQQHAGHEVWLRSLDSSCGISGFTLVRSGTSWKGDYLGALAVFAGGQRLPAVFTAIACSPLQIHLAHHPFSGGVRIRVSSESGTLLAESVVDLYRPGDTIYAPVSLTWFNPDSVYETAFPLPASAASADVIFDTTSAGFLREAHWSTARGTWKAHVLDPALPKAPDGRGLVLHIAELQPISFWKLRRPDWVFLITSLGLLLITLAIAVHRRTRAYAAAQWTWARYSAGPAAAWTAYWLAFFPGVVSFDPLVQWGQIVHGRFDDWHPAAHTWALWLATGFGSVLGSAALIQVLLAACVIGRLFSLLRKQGVPAWAVWAAVAWISLSPAIAFNVIAIWKDAAFGLVLLWITLLLLRLVDTSVLGLRAGIAFGLAAALACLFRHNGILVAVPILIAVAWLARRERRAVLGMALTAAATLLLVRGVLYRIEKVTPAPAVVSLHGVVHHIAGLLSAGTPVDSRDLKTIEEIAPIEQWRSDYVCFSCGRLIFGPHSIDHQRLQGRGAALISVWWHLARRNPRAALQHQLCVTRFLWSPRSELYIGPLDRDGSTIDPNDLGLAAESLWPSLQHRLTNLIERSFSVRPVARALIWQPAIALYLMLAALLGAVLRRGSITPLVLGLPMISNTSGWLVLAAVPDLRFQWPVLVVAPVALCFFLVRKRETT